MDLIRLYHTSVASVVVVVVAAAAAAAAVSGLG